MAEPKTASLTVLGGPLAGVHCPLPETGSLTIGSAPGSTLHLDIPSVSPYHARILVEDGRITVHDTGSDRTVHVNDNTLDPEGTELRNGDILWLGNPGDEDVVMLQCILPKRSTAPAAAPVPSPLASGATPTPEIETVALWASGAATEAAAEAAAEEPLEVAPAVAEDELFTAAAAAAESVSFEDEAEAVVVEDAQIVGDAATLMMSGPDEIVEPALVIPEGGETVAFEAETAYEPTDFAPPPVAPAEPTVAFDAPAAPAPPPPPPPPPAPAPPPAAPAKVAAPVAARPPEPHAPREPRPAAPARPAAARPAPHATHAPHAPKREPRPAAPRAPEPVAEPADLLEEGAPASRRPMLLPVGVGVGVLVLAGLGWLAWQKLGSRPATPAATPTPVARASTPTPPPAPVTIPEAATPEPAVATTPAPLATPTPTIGTPMTQAPTPQPRPTPTPAATPQGAAARPTPAPAAAGPSPEELRAQQTAAQAQGLVTQAEAAIGARQYDAAIGHLDAALRLTPGLAQATSLRAEATRRRDLARRRFVAGRTVVDSEKTRKEKARGGLVGFDTDEKAPDFLGRIEFEMSPATGVEANDAWTLRVFVVNQGAKPIKVTGMTVSTTVDGAGSGGPVEPSAREIAPQQRVLVAESKGSWRDGTTAWVTEATVSAPKNESLRNTLTWK